MERGLSAPFSKSPRREQLSSAASQQDTSSAMELLGLSSDTTGVPIPLATSSAITSSSKFSLNKKGVIWKKEWKRTVCLFSYCVVVVTRVNGGRIDWEKEKNCWCCYWEKCEQKKKRVQVCEKENEMKRGLWWWWFEVCSYTESIFWGGVGWFGGWLSGVSEWRRK